MAKKRKNRKQTDNEKQWVDLINQAYRNSHAFDPDRAQAKYFCHHGGTSLAIPRTGPVLSMTSQRESQEHQFSGVMKMIRDFLIAQEPTSSVAVATNLQHIQWCFTSRWAVRSYANEWADIFRSAADCAVVFLYAESPEEFKTMKLRFSGVSPNPRKIRVTSRTLAHHTPRARRVQAKSAPEKASRSVREFPRISYVLDEAAESRIRSILSGD